MELDAERRPQTPGAALREIDSVIEAIEAGQTQQYDASLTEQHSEQYQKMTQKQTEGEGKTVMLITHSVDEAIYLASRIVVVTARPARIREIIEVPFPYPRDESIQERAEFAELRKHVRELVMNEYRAQQAQMRPASFSE